MHWLPSRHEVYRCVILHHHRMTPATLEAMSVNTSLVAGYSGCVLLSKHACHVLLQVPALLAVGLEGCWGLLLCSFVLPVTSLVKGKDGFPLDDAVAAARSIFSNSELGLAVYSSILSIAFFNFFGVSGGQAQARFHRPDCRGVWVWPAVGRGVVALQPLFVALVLACVSLLTPALAAALLI